MNGPFLSSKPATFYTPEKAEELASLLNADAGDDWTYKAVHDPTGRGLSYIEVKEAGEPIGTL